MEKREVLFEWVEMSWGICLRGLRMDGSDLRVGLVEDFVFLYLKFKF